MPSSAAWASPAARSRLGLHGKRARADSWTSATFPQSVSFFLWHSHPGWRGSVPGGRHEVHLVNTVFLPRTAAMSSSCLVWWW